MSRVRLTCNIPLSIVSEVPENIQEFAIRIELMEVERMGFSQIRYHIRQFGERSPSILHFVGDSGC